MRVRDDGVADRPVCSGLPLGVLGRDGGWWLAGRWRCWRKSRGGHPGWGVDDPGPGQRGFGPGESAAGGHSEGSGEVERDGGDSEPGAVGVERFGWLAW